MGQYFVAANCTKRQYVDPDVLCENNKYSSLWITTIWEAIGLLLRTPSPLLPHHPLLGSWLGDRVVPAGDETPANQVLDSEAPATESAWNVVFATFEDISQAALDLLCTIAPPKARALVDWLCDNLSLDQEVLLHLGDIALRFQNQALHTALYERLGAAWTEHYERAHIAHREQRRPRGQQMSPHRALALPPLQAQPTRAVRLTCGWHIPREQDVLVINPVKQQFIAASLFRVTGERAGLYDGLVMEGARSLLKYGGPWHQDRFVVLGPDAPLSLAGVLLATAEEPTRPLYDLVRESWQDVSQEAFDGIELYDYRCRMEELLAQTRRFPIDLYIASDAAFGLTNGEGWEGEERLSRVAQRLRALGAGEVERAAQELAGWVAALVVDPTVAEPLRLAGSFADFDSLEQELRHSYQEEIRYSLREALLHKHRDDERGWLVLERKEAAEMVVSCAEGGQNPEAGSPRAPKYAALWQELAATQVYTTSHLLFVQRDLGRAGGEGIASSGNQG